MCISNSSALLTFSVDFVDTRTLKAGLVLQPRQIASSVSELPPQELTAHPAQASKHFFCPFVLPVVIPVLLFCRQNIKLALIFQVILQVYDADIKLWPRG